MEETIQVTVLRADAASPELLRKLNSASNAWIEDRGLLYIRQGEQIFCCPDDPAGRRLMDAFSGASEAAPVSYRNAEEAWRGWLVKQQPEALRALRESFGIRNRGEYRVTVFQEAGMSTERLSRTIRDLFPEASSGFLLDIRRGEAAFIHDGHALSAEDWAEYVKAVIEMGESEGGVSMVAGIGTLRDAASLPESFREAREAIELGRQFRMKAPVFFYEKQLLQRLVNDLPEKKRAEWRERFWRPPLQKTMTNDMRETVLAFFENDLNLSTTARQLFLHRNTLTYRLDRIRRETGLDLRRFHDAVIFQLMMEIPDESDQRGV